MNLSRTASRADPLSWLRLALTPGVTPTHQRRLLSRFRTPECVLAASGSQVQAVCGEGVADALRTGPPREWLDRAMAWLEVEGHHVVGCTDPAYPEALLHIYDPPTLLYVRGRPALLDSRAFAIVGSRNATAQGARDAEAIAEAIGHAGYAIVSGLALGIDAAAHRGGLRTAASTIAVLGCGSDRIYPERNRELARAIAAEGAIVSEFPLGTEPLPGNFPKRNRIISGLSRGVLVVEAAVQSGSLWTARFALEQGRDVFAMPGSVHSALSKGCHHLIKEGAKLVETPDDILEELEGVARAPSGMPMEVEAQPHPLLDAMGFSPVSIDEIAQRTGRGAAAVAADLSQLEIEGVVASVPGGRFQRLVSAGKCAESPVIE